MRYRVYSDELYHHGITGQKWGRRRYQNEDGSVTSAGAVRYYVHDGRVRHDGNGENSTGSEHSASKKQRTSEQDTRKASEQDTREASENTQKKSGSTAKTAAKVAAGLAVAALAVYGGKKLNEYVHDENNKQAMDKSKEAIQKFMQSERAYDLAMKGDEYRKKGMTDMADMVSGWKLQEANKAGFDAYKEHANVSFGKAAANVATEAYYRRRARLLGYDPRKA